MQARKIRDRRRWRFALGSAIGMVLVATGCRPADIASLTERYSSAPFRQQSTKGCLEVSAIYIAPEMRAWNAMSAAGKKLPAPDSDWDSALARVSMSRTLEFRIRIAPSPACRDTLNPLRSDVAFGLGARPRDPASANLEFQQSLGGKFWLRAGGERLAPAFFHMESAYGLDDARQVWMVFKHDALSKETWKKVREIALVAEGLGPGRNQFMLTWPSRVIADGM